MPPAHAPSQSSSTPDSPPAEPKEEKHGEGSVRVVVAALAINLAIAAIKFIAALLSRSAGMLAEALHSLADTANQIFLLIGHRRSERPADEDHPFGYATESYFWAFIVALCIFAVGGAVSIIEGIEKLLHPQHQIENFGWAFGVLITSILLESYSFYVALGEFREIRKGRSVRRTIRETRDPTVLTVLFEDLAALFGLVVATTGISLTYLTGSTMWDSIASIGVGLALVCVAYVLGRDAKSLLIGKSVPPEEQRQIEEIARTSPDVLEVIHIRTLHFGPKDVMCGLKLHFNHQLDIHTLEVRINELEARLRDALPHLRYIYVEAGFDERAGGGESLG